MSYEIDPVMLEDVQDPIETARQYKEFGQCAKRTLGAAVALIMAFTLPNMATSKVIVEKVSIASLTCGSEGIHKERCDMPVLGRTSRDMIQAALVRTQ
ncbi:MAG TPA: hypothetical protein VEF76_09610 [Patescibacteria group bacterium]|nr:hypothetical protein [Patescibacteria group bacterium]